MRIEDRLRTQLGRAGQTVPVAALDIEDTLAKGRRARRVAFARAAGAAVIVIGMSIGGATTLMNGAVERPIPPAGDHSPRPSATVTPEPTEAEIESVVRLWLQALNDGDQEAAWALMTEEARAEVGRARFDALMRSALPERFGAFAAPSVDIEVVEIESSGGDAGVVTTMTRSLRKQGASEAIPLRIQVGTPFVDEIFEDRDPVVTVWTSSSLGPRPFRAGDELPVEGISEGISSNIERVYLSIDGAPAQRAQLDRSTGNALVTLDRALESGLHVATIVMVDGNGRMIPDARVFDAASP